jgi:hypothetical protein
VFAEVGLFSSLNEIAFLLFVPSVLQMIGKQELKVLYIIIILYVGASTGPWKAVRIQIAVCTCASPAFVPETSLPAQPAGLEHVRDKIDSC